jgi:hypothetical protein
MNVVPAQAGPRVSGAAVTLANSDPRLRWGDVSQFAAKIFANVVVNLGME